MNKFNLRTYFTFTLFHIIILFYTYCCVAILIAAFQYCQNSTMTDVPESMSRLAKKAIEKNLALEMFNSAMKLEYLEYEPRDLVRTVLLYKNV